MSLTEKIKQRRQELMLTQSDLAKKAGISYGGIQAYERGQIPKGDNLFKIARALECSMDWLMGGQDLMEATTTDPPMGEVRQPKPVYLETPQGEPPPSAPPDPDSALPVFIPRIDSRLVAGEKVPVPKDQPRDHYFFRNDWLQKTMGSSKNLVLMDVEGDSMKPTLEQGDCVMIDLGRKSITGGNIYALGEGETILLKRIQPLLGGKIRVISDNSAIYESQELDLARNPIQIIGIVVWVAKKLISKP